jgi:uncharacterized protein (DUF2249 family)
MDSTLERLYVPSLPPARRHAVIFATFDALPEGGAFDIINDHDPMPLYAQFERQRSGQFAWTWLASGPQQWQVRIARTRPGTGGAVSSGCGGHGGCGCSGG